MFLMITLLGLNLLKTFGSTQESASNLTVLKKIEQDSNCPYTELVLRVDADNRYKGGEKRVNQVIGSVLG